MTNYTRNRKQLRNYRRSLARYLTLHDRALKDVESTFEAKMKLPGIYMKWAKRLRA